MRHGPAASLVASLSLFAACGGGEDKPAAVPSPKADETVTFELGEENRSGSSGTATLKGGDGGFTVRLVVKHPKRTGPAHIHDVTCEEYRATKGFDAQLATVDTPLADVNGGKSRTRVDTALSHFRTAGYSINVHSTAGGFPVTACGDIPAG
jgi:hypothetical protein